MRVVVDASMALSWCFEDEHDDLSDRALAEVLAVGGIVPPLWRLEVVNVLVVAERRGRITPADGARFIALLDALPIELSEFDPGTAELCATARAHNLTASDASYLLAAVQSGARLATRDEALLRAAASLGVSLLD